MDRALVSGTKGRRFEPGIAYQQNQDFVSNLAYFLLLPKALKEPQPLPAEEMTWFYTFKVPLSYNPADTLGIPSLILGLLFGG